MPFLHFETLAASLPDLGDFAALAVTSTNTIRALGEQNLLGQVQSLPLFAVGEKTADAARRAGFLAITTGPGSLPELAKTISARPPAGPLLYLGAQDRSGDLAGLLHEAAIEVETLPVYKMMAKTRLSRAEQDLITRRELAGALFYSTRTAQAFIAACDNADLNIKDRLDVFCLSPNIAKTFQQAGFGSIHIANAPNERAILALVLSFAALRRK